MGISMFLSHMKSVKEHGNFHVAFTHKMSKHGNFHVPFALVKCKKNKKIFVFLHPQN